MAELKVLGVAVAGAALGVAIGASFGLATFPALAMAASIGFSVGTLVGQQLFPEQIKQEGSRINDLAVSSSAFGAVRPIVYGSVRIGGNVIWAKPIREQKNTSKKGKGGSGPSVTSTTYTYYGSFALALAEGPIDGVMRIWADSKLIYDASATGTGAVGPDLPAQAQIISKNGLKFRFYPGSEDQMPDSLIQADKGAENVPAYRGTCYIVFDDLPLADYGNRLPNITCEIYQVQKKEYPYQVWTPVPDPDSIFGPDSVGNQSMGVDWDRNVVYMQGQNPNGLKVVDAASFRTIREIPFSEVLAAGDNADTAGGIVGNVHAGFAVGPDGGLYFSVTGNPDNPGFYGRIVRVDPNTLKETAEVGYNLGIFGAGELFEPQFLTFLSYFSTTGMRVDTMIVQSFWGSWAALSLPDLEFITGDASTVPIAQGAVQGKIELGTGDAWLLFGPTLLGGPVMEIFRVRYEGTTVSTVGLESPFKGTSGVILSPAMFDPVALQFRQGLNHAFVYDEADDSLIFTMGTAIDAIAGPIRYWIAKWSEASGLVWFTELPNYPSSHVGNQPRISGGTFGLNTFNHFIQISTATGEILRDDRAGTGAGDGWPMYTLNSFQTYDSVTQTMVGYYNVNAVPIPGGWAKAFLGRGSGQATTLGTIVSDQCKRAGFTVADIEISTLTDEIEGYVISQRATVTDILAPLLGAYLIDRFETDYKLKFIHRGGAPVASVAQDDLIRGDEQSAMPYTETRQQEIELPMRLTITYVDKDRDYQTNTAAVKRIRNPDPTVFSDNQVDVQIALVTTATPAKQMAETLLFTTWNERHTFATKLSPEFDYLDPGDVVTLSLNDGYTARMRLGDTTLGVDYSVDVKLVGETDGQYISVAEADPGVPWIGSHFIFAAGKSELILLDVPLLRDIDDMAGRAMRVYWGGGPFTRSPWPGAVLQQSDVASSIWTTLAPAQTDMTWGYIDSPPEDWPPLFATQDELHGGVIIVGIIGGTYLPSSVTDIDIANFANPLAVIKTNGQVEIIQYRDATALGGGRWRLSTLRRGLRGTDTMAFGHTAGELFLFLDDNLLEIGSLPLSQRNVTEFYRLVTIGMIPDDANVEPFTFHSRDQMPYAPVNAKRTHVGSDGVMTWTRRTRIGGMLEDGTDAVPLAETAERYEVYFLNEAAAGGFDPTNPATYTRAFLGLTAPTLTYTAAMMAADGFDPTTGTVYAVIYQISSVVGRGFSSLHVLPPVGPLTVALEDGSGEWDGWTWG